ncbi:jmjC domain-containing histone demethylation protein 1-like [Ctenocephalides felis]|uniref:jmjC domain-containing histone demethylation protein 1-like n=1 Tax=Ctenocephalides felis TaxID=7515 RepID=UPI000E6E5437|nr:jmjC domain-containing histone demethylation protein 1-like [Ctenocephalides felis]
MILEMHGSDLTVEYLQRHGFNTPLLFREKTGLGLRVPTKNFTINDVRMCVGSRRVLEVMDVNTQKNIQMTMKEWQKYYEDPDKKELLNVISLEFSHTKLENYIQSPTVVRQIDWVDVVWPRRLKESQTESTNLIDEMMYPKVQKYCLMSVKNCYTDFHVDFGGTSVWYHILKGSKVFWLIPPTEDNLQKYEKWVLSGKQSDVFFGDQVEKCGRVKLTEGNTFFIPTGWIHAVYTPCDSLVFGGNFLHSYGIVKQLKIAQVEDSTKVPQKFRYPFFTEMLWYVLARYVHILLGKDHLYDEKNENDMEEEEDRHDSSAFLNGKPHVHLTKMELHGLKEIVTFLHLLPNHKKSLPELLRNAVALIRDVRKVVELHFCDNAELAITGRPVLTPLDSPYGNNLQHPSGGSYVSNHYLHEKRLHNNLTPVRSVGRPPKITYDSEGNPIPHRGPGRPPGSKKNPNNSSSSSIGHHNNSGSSPNMDKNGGPRRRRTRCKKCEACQRSDCGECTFCLDMVKFGGPGRAKQTCNMRQCLQPMLPVTAACALCGLDGWGRPPVATSQQVRPLPHRDGALTASALMECCICYEIAHPSCVRKTMSPNSMGSENAEGVVNEDLPNSWECPLCCRSGKNADYRPRHFRARQKSSDIRRMSISSDASSAIEHKHMIDNDGCNSNGSEDEEEDVKPTLPIKQEHDDTEILNLDTKKRKSEEGVTITSAKEEQSEPPRKLAVRMQFAHHLSSNSTKVLKKPMYPVRPGPLTQPVISHGNHYALDTNCLLKIFEYLPQSELLRCALVCKTWAKVSIDPSLWKVMTIKQCRLSASLLSGIIRRQPEHLILDWTTIAKRQLIWLLARLPTLKILSLQGNPASGVIGLRTCYCPPIHDLDLSFVQSFNDAALRDILSPPLDSRPGLADSKTRLRHLRILKLAGTDISDISLRYITQNLQQITNLDLSSCQRITDAGIAQLATTECTIVNLKNLNLSGCKLITELTLEHLSRCQQLSCLDLRHAPQVSTQAVIKFAAKSKLDLQCLDVKLVDKRRNKQT